MSDKQNEGKTVVPQMALIPRAVLLAEKWRINEHIKNDMYAIEYPIGYELLNF